MVRVKHQAGVLVYAISDYCAPSHISSSVSYAEISDMYHPMMATNSKK